VCVRECVQDGRAYEDLPSLCSCDGVCVCVCTCVCVCMRVRVCVKERMGEFVCVFMCECVRGCGAAICEDVPSFRSRGYVVASVSRID